MKYQEIKEKEQDILNSEDAITTLTLDNDRKLDQINSKKTAIDNLSGDTELIEEGRDQMKTLEKEKKAITNKQEKEKRT